MRIATAVLLVLLALPAQAAVLYVDASATGAGTGASWTDAYVSLQDALAAAQSGDEVWVADGVYYPDQGAAQTEGRRASTFALQNGVAVYGGFAGGEGSRDDRDPVANPTILSGDLGALSVPGDNAFHVVTASGAGASAVLDGFTVRDGVATGAGQNRNGGGLYVRGTDPAVGPTLRALVVRDNRAVTGGGLYVSGAAPLVEDVVFETNRSDTSGGGASVEGGAAVFTGSSFLSNMAPNGAGLSAAGSSTVTIRDGRFERNESLSGGDGGGLFSTAPVLLTDVAFVGNLGHQGGGANLRARADLVRTSFESNGGGGYGGGLYLGGEARVVSSTFSGNTAYYGGAVQVAGDGVVFSRVAFVDNQAFGYGGAMFATSELTLVNVEIRGNSAAYSGGGIYAVSADLSVINSTVVGNRAEGESGGGLSLADVAADLLFATVAGNTAGSAGGGIYVGGGAETVSIRNSVVGANVAASGADEIAVVEGASVLVRRSAVEGGVPGGAADGGSNVSTVGFAAPLAGDYRLGAGSAALDAGNVAALPPDEFDVDDDGDTSERLPIDVAGGPRVVGAGLDLGAFEGAQPNAAPTATADLAETTEDEAVVFNVLANDSDPNGDPLTLVSVDAPAGGAVAFEADGTVTYTPGDNFAGVDRFAYTVSDGTAEARGRVTISVDDVDDPPVAVDDEAVVSGDYFLFAYGTEVEVLRNDRDPDGGLLTIEGVSQPANGYAEPLYSYVEFDGTSVGFVRYRPNSEFYGTDTFTYTIVDEGGNRATATVTVRMNGAPQIVSPPQTEAAVGESYSYTVVAEDPNGDALSLRANTYYGGDLPAWLTFTDNGDGTGTLAGTPTEDDLGAFVDIIITVSDGATETQQYFYVVVRSPDEINRPPVAVDDEVTVEENGFVAIDVTANDSDPNGDFLYVGGVSTAAFGTAYYSYYGGLVYYYPAPGFSGTDQFTYTVTDYRGGEATATVTVTVTPVNDAPVFTTLPSPQAVVGQRYEGAVAATDIDGDAIALAAGPLPSWLSFRDNGDGTGLLSGTPRPTDEGLFRVALRVSDGSVTTEQTVDISVTGSGVPPSGTAPRDTPPTVRPDETATAEDEAVTVEVLRNDRDPEGGRPALIAVTQPANGTARANRDGTVTYTPDPDFNGADFFTYSAHAQNGRVGSSQVAVQVQAVNDAPTVRPAAFETDGGTPLVVAAPGLLASAADVDGDALTVALGTAPPASEGAVVVRPDGSFTFTPAAGFAGETRFSFVVRDGDGAEATAVATVRVGGAVGAPAVVAPPTRPAPGAVLALDGDGAFTVEWAPVRDPDGDAVTYRWEVYIDGRALPAFTAATAATSVTVAVAELRAALAAAGAPVGRDVDVRHRVVATDGTNETPGVLSTLTVRLSASTAGELAPPGFVHLGPRPNPVRDRTAVALDLPWAADVRVEVFDVTGRQVLRVEDRMNAGTNQTVTLDARSLPAGLYVYRLTATATGSPEAHASGRLTVVR